jgi:uncharacterized membrane protein
MQWLFLLGVATGMRTMTAITVLCWFAWAGGFPPASSTWAWWTTKLVAVAIFTLFALGEYVGDVLPQTPSRKTFFPTLARLIVGGLVGAIGSAMMLQPAAGGVILGVLGAALGTWGGWWVRHWLAEKLHRDRPAGMLESAFALVMAIVVCICVHIISMEAMWTQMRMAH